MENNKYFVPEISDFCIGYEFETIYLKSVWTKESLNIMDAGWFFECYHNDAVPTEFRVPYLTKEQIEAEGFKLIENELIWCPGLKFIHIPFYKDNIWCYLGWDNFIWIGVDKGKNCLYTGECKDINTFRKIIKLLGI